MIGAQQGAEVDLFAYFISRSFGIRHYGAIYGVIAMAGALSTAIALVSFGKIHDATGSYDLALTIGAVCAMNVIYCSDHFWIFAYPAQHGFELVDKCGLRTVYLDGASAWHFRPEMEEVPEDERNEEYIDAFLHDYCSGVARPIVVH